MWRAHQFAYQQAVASGEGGCLGKLREDLRHPLTETKHFKHM